MIVEQRDYHVITGKLPELVKLYETEGIELQQSYLGSLLGVFTTDIGALLHSAPDRRHRKTRCCHLDRPEKELGERRALWIEYQQDPCQLGRKLFKKLQPFGSD